MKRYRFLSAAVVGMFFYVLISVLIGRDGVLAYNHQLQQKHILSARTESIQKINDALFLECTALEKDSDVIAGLAKKLGFVSDGDKIVKINGLSFDNEKIYDAGTPIKAVESDYLPEWTAKAFGLAVFAIVYLYFLSKDINRGGFKRKKQSVFLEGIPVYDLPQV